MQSSIVDPKIEQYRFGADKKEDIWIKPVWGKELATAWGLEKLSPDCGRRIEIIFPDYVNVVSKAFLIAFITDTCKNFENIEQFREVVRIKADPITTRDFWQAVRECFNLPPEKKVPWYKRLIPRIS